MTKPLGALCLVLHGHLPWVLHHGRWPHGEDWLFEAASATWLPLLDVLDACRDEGLSPGWTVGMTPILLEQLAHPRFRDGFVDWLDERAERARHDARTFDDPHFAWLADRYARGFAAQRVAFEGMRRDLPGAVAEHARAGRVELLSSNATHGYHPLLLHDACARAQIRAGLATSARHLGHRPRGVWLPECAYRPDGPWRPPAVHGDVRDRDGVATLFAREGAEFFFVDAAVLRGATPFATLDQGRVGPPYDDPRLGWTSPLEPHRVVERGVVTDLTVLARDPRASEQVWSGDVGYPGDGRYLEFHKRHGLRGLRYWGVTGRHVDLGGKQPYHPDAAAEAVQGHAHHFAELVRHALRDHHAATGRQGIVCAPFDAELFGHWWHEGPAFLLEVARRLAPDPEVATRTVSDALEHAPADKAAVLPEGTWGASGDHRVWLNDDLLFYWEIAYRAEDRFLDLWHRADWERDAAVGALLSDAARQLLLLQASDWPFVITTRGAVDYGMRRILEHAARFDDLCNGVEDLVAGRPLDPVVEAARAFCRATDPVFPDLDLRWWS